ncbi:DUF4240 domain-containing protein [Streptomyces fagopyri]|uniref:DUF4240 domain-containing protein n=1 Tax=Streptomyces fagopyri TaxID=2662397 RepID=UPI0036832E3E
MNWANVQLADPRSKSGSGLMGIFGIGSGRSSVKRSDVGRVARVDCQRVVAECAVMESDTFWGVIEAAQVGAAATGEPFDEVLVQQLAERPRQEILEYAERFDELRDALYRWDVWAAAYLIGGGCSDDSFMDFRAGVIALGCQWYQRVAADPDSLAAHPDVVQAANGRDRSEVLFYEDVNYAASGAFERITGDADAFYEAWRSFRGVATESDNAVDMGDDFNFDDDREMSRRLPRLAALFLGTSP